MLINNGIKANQARNESPHWGKEAVKMIPDRIDGNTLEIGNFAFFSVEEKIPGKFELVIFEV